MIRLVLIGWLPLVMLSADARASESWEYNFNESCEDALKYLRADAFTVVCSVTHSYVNLAAGFNQKIKTLEERLGKPLKVGRLVVTNLASSTVMMCAKVKVRKSPARIVD